MARIIQSDELQGDDAAGLARGLLGKLLVVHSAGSGEPARRHRICEVEAYDGERDLACHASKGRTPRNQVLYHAGGVWYVYLCYGIHEMLNLVTGPADWPSAILIRGVEGFIGPGRLTRALGIDRRFNNLPAAPATGLWIEDDGFVVPAKRIHATPRIGVDYAGPIWAAKPWRFFYDVPPAPRTPASAKHSAIAVETSSNVIACKSSPRRTTRT